MARIITLDELIHTEEATGWIEEFYEADDDLPDRVYLSAAAYNSEQEADLDGMQYFDYKKYNVRKNGGYRIWDSRPTKEEREKTEWRVI